MTAVDSYLKTATADMYFDSAYIVKYYLNDPDARVVRTIIREAPSVSSSAWALVEVTSALHRRIREGRLTIEEGRETMDAFRTQANAGLWNLMPITDSILQRTVGLFRVLPQNVPLRAGDALHLATALDAGEPELWTNDRHLLAAASHFGLIGRCVSQ